MAPRTLGKTYKDGEVIVRQGEMGKCMYVIEAGQVEVIHESESGETHLAVLGKSDFFGEMAVFERAERSATVRALGEVQALTVDKATFLRRISEDPSLAFRVVQKMSHRIRELNTELARFKGTPPSVD